MPHDDSHYEIGGLLCSSRQRQVDAIKQDLTIASNANCTWGLGVTVVVGVGREEFDTSFLHDLVGLAMPSKEKAILGVDLKQGRGCRTVLDRWKWDQKESKAARSSDFSAWDNEAAMITSEMLNAWGPIHAFPVRRRVRIRREFKDG
mmetsp:Transcript_12062/g.24558  ORF Transcript_12062/g.24558 Transcript_12062/m.24558 type:complete len:147 (-) Transcript_12062:351-791(-)